MAIFPFRAPPSVVVTSDASGEWGCGAWMRLEWFQFQWPANLAHHHIAFKELSADLLAAAVWGAVVEGAASAMAMRQSGGGVCSNGTVVSRQIAHTPPALPVFLRGALPV